MLIALMLATIAAGMATAIFLYGHGALSAFLSSPLGWSVAALFAALWIAVRDLVRNRSVQEEIQQALNAEGRRSEDGVQRPPRMRDRLRARFHSLLR